jgi:Rha family phage regulatory protein
MKLEIAELTGKRHANVLRDIRKVLDEVEIDQAKFGSTYLDVYNREQSCFNLPRMECDLVVSGYSAKYRMAIIKRWQEPKASKNRANIGSYCG